MVVGHARVYPANVPGEAGPDAQRTEVPQGLPGFGDRSQLWLIQLMLHKDLSSVRLGYPAVVKAMA